MCFLGLGTYFSYSFHAFSFMISTTSFAICGRNYVWATLNKVTYFTVITLFRLSLSFACVVISTWTSLAVTCMGLEANEGANLTHNQNFKLVILSIEKHNITEIIEN